MARVYAKGNWNQRFSSADKFPVSLFSYFHSEFHGRAVWYFTLQPETATPGSANPTTWNRRSLPLRNILPDFLFLRISRDIYSRTLVATFYGHVTYVIGNIRKFHSRYNALRLSLTVLIKFLTNWTMYVDVSRYLSRTYKFRRDRQNIWTADCSLYWLGN